MNKAFKGVRLRFDEKAGTGFFSSSRFDGFDQQTLIT